MFLFFFFMWQFSMVDPMMEVVISSYHQYSLFDTSSLVGLINQIQTDVVFTFGPPKKDACEKHRFGATSGRSVYDTSKFCGLNYHLYHNLGYKSSLPYILDGQS